jgi:radical SAM superfamily enzyme YgiQ (UPF0313 family)
MSANAGNKGVLAPSRALTRHTPSDILSDRHAAVHQNQARFLLPESAVRQEAPMRIALVRTYQRQMVDDIAHPLGIMALDAYLRERGYDDIHLHDMRLKKETPEEAATKVLALNPDIVGLSSLTLEKDSVHALAGIIKKRAPHVTVMLGGPYATSSRLTAMRDPAIDLIVVGEGEITFHELLETMKQGGDLSTVQGIVYREAGEVKETPERPYIQDLDILPFPSWDRIDIEAYDAAGCVDALTASRWVVFYTSRGCPFRCTYCHDVFGKKFRARSPQKVIDEMELLHDRFGIRSFQFYDDIFNFDKKRVLEICRLIVEKGWKIDMQFPNGVRADMMDVELLAALKSAGTIRVNYAIESASPRIQKSVRKFLKLDKVKKLIEDTDRMGILVHGYFMLGFPGETREEIQSTIDWAVNSRLHTAAFYLVCPFEGTPLSEQYVAPAKETHGTDWEYFNNPHSMSEVPAAELKKLQREAYLKFYLNPLRMLRFARLLPRKSVFLRFVPIFLKIVGSGFKIQGANKDSWDHAPESIDALVAARTPSMEVPDHPAEQAHPPEIVTLGKSAKKVAAPAKTAEAVVRERLNS